jgi:hypothetical protein
MLQNSASGGGFFGAARGNLYSALEAIFAAPKYNAPVGDALITFIVDNYIVYVILPLFK